MMIINKNSISLDDYVKIINQERLSIDVLFRASALEEEYENVEAGNNDFFIIKENIEMVDDLAIVGKVNVKVYDDKWCDFWYAADADGAHEHIFSRVVVPVDKESISPKHFKENDGMLDGKHIVWGRVGIIDNNFHDFSLLKECWNKEVSKNLFIEMEDYLVDILNLDFLLIDLEFLNMERVKEHPGLFLLGETKNLLSLNNEFDYHKLRKDVSNELLELGFIPAVNSNNTNYWIRNYSNDFTYKTKSKNNKRKIKEILKSF